MERQRARFRRVHRLQGPAGGPRAHRLQHRLALLPQVVPHDRRKARRVAGLERLHHLRMLRRGAAPLHVVEVGAEAQALDAQVERHVRLAQVRVAGAGVDAIVDLAIAVVVRGQIAPCVAREHLERQRLDLGDLGGRDALARKLARQRLQRAHELEALADVGLRQAHHLGAAIGTEHHEAIGLEQPERLAQRGPRHAEFHAQHALVQAGTGRELAFGDEDAQALGDARGKRGWRRRHAHRRGLRIAVR